MTMFPSCTGAVPLGHQTGTHKHICGCSDSADETDEATASTSSLSESDALGDGHALSSVPFGERAMVVADGSRLGRRMSSQRNILIVKGKSNDAQLPGKRKDKHAPMEERISKKPVSVVRDSVQRKRARHLDPRFTPDSHGSKGIPDGVARRSDSAL